MTLNTKSSAVKNLFYSKTQKHSLGPLASFVRLGRRGWAAPSRVVLPGRQCHCWLIPPAGSPRRSAAGRQAGQLGGGRGGGGRCCRGGEVGGGTGGTAGGENATEIVEESVYPGDEGGEDKQSTYRR